jgi:hypothetical protein
VSEAEEMPYDAAPRDRAYALRIVNGTEDCHNRTLRRCAVALMASVVVTIASGCLRAPELELAESADRNGAAADPDSGASLAATDAAVEAALVDGAGAAAEACAEHCPGAGGTCDAGTCVISCPGSPACNSVVTCPTGLDCSITCIGKEACRGVACGDAASCIVHCEGEQACKGKVTSNALETSIFCIGKDACDTDVACSGATCAIQCSPVGDGCDEGKVRCCATSCTLNGAPGSCPF